VKSLGQATLEKAFRNLSDELDDTAFGEEEARFLAGLNN